MNTAAPSRSSDVLLALLEEHRERERLEFDDAHNHAPMVLIALWRLGAPDARLRGYSESLRHDPPQAGSAAARATIEADAWMRSLGDLAAWSAYRAFFAAEIDRAGAEGTLRGYIDELMSGVAGHAFHPLIRLAYGVELGAEQEIASGLAYWAATYRAAPPVPPGRSALPPGELLHRLQNSDAAEPGGARGTYIDARIESVYRRTAFCERLAPLAVDAARPLEEIAVAVADAFAARHDFTLLHAVTSCHALRTVLPYVADPVRAVSEYWYAVCAACLTLARTDGPGSSGLPTRETDWPDIRGRAIASGIEHTIKLVWTCESEGRAYGRDCYRRLALREVERSAPFV
jgi:Questin oxidase-like